MARNKRKKRGKSKKKAAKRANRYKRNQISHISTMNQDTTRDREQTNHATMMPREKPAASLRGGDASVAAHHRTITFNPSTINAHDEGDQDVTLLDVSPAKPSEEELNQSFDEASPVESRGMDIFKVGSMRDRPRKEENKPGANSQRSLEDIIADNPDTRLSKFDEQTLSFAGHTVRQVVVEATYGFFQKCVPESEQKGLWNQICDRAKEETATKYSIFLPDGIMDLKNGVRSTSHLIGNCIGVLSQNAPVTDQTSLRLSLSRAVTLCDALGDEKRKQALEKATYELNWVMLGLDCKTMELYRGANQQLDQINLDYPVLIEAGRASGAGICDERRVEERSILQSMKWAHEGFKEPFRVRFIKTLQTLLELET